MEENTELEEGEACYCKDDDEDNIDLDSLSYIDERIQNALGHFQKDFEGGMSAEKLGAKFGGYGSFLPTYERSPCFWSNPKTPQRNQSTPKSPVNLHTESVSHNKKAPINVPPFARPGNSSHSLRSFHDLRAVSVEDSVKKGSGISSTDVAERCTLKVETTKKTGNSTDQRTLKFRIKMKSNILAQKKAEIYSGLGLDNSPSSSMGNSPVETEGVPPVSQESAEDSPTGIIQVMTSFPISGGVLISPLHESLLYLTENEEVTVGSRYLSSLNGHQETCSMSTDESDSFAGDGNLKRRTERIMRQNEKPLRLKHMNGTLSENEMALHKKRRLGNKTPDRKDFLSNDLKWTPLSSSICDAGETAEVTAKASEVSKEVNENGDQGRMGFVESLKEESLESISGQDFEMIEKKNTGNGFSKNVLEPKQKNSCKDNSTDPLNDDNKRNVYTLSKKVERDAVKRKVDLKYETHQKVKVVSGGKNKSKGDKSPVKSEAITRKNSFDVTNNAVVTGKGSAGFVVTSRSKMNKTKSLKDNKVRDGNKDSLKEKKSERKVDGYAGNNAIKSSCFNYEKHSAFGTKVKERPSANKAVNQLLAVPGVKDASGVLPCAEKNPAPEMIPSAVAIPQLIEENWVCCDSCQKWRLLPTGVKPEQLPEKWLCSMLDWLPGMNQCNFSEDETTNALRAMYQIPIYEGQNNMQSHANGIATGGSSSDALQFSLNHKKSSSDVLSVRGKMKPVIKEKTMSGKDMLQFSNSAKTNAQVSRKNRSLNDMNQHPTDLNPIKKISSKHFSRTDDVVEEKHVPIEKEKKIQGGDRKHIKLKRKMDADQSKLGNPLKKSKTENVSDADKQLKPGMNLENVALNSRNGASGTGKQTELNQKDFEDSVLKMEGQCRTDKKIVSQQNLTREFGGENKTNPVRAESSDGKSKVLSSAVGELIAPDQQHNVLSPVRTNSNRTATDTLEEASKLKDRAEHFKNSGFDFESNETYFQAGLKFLHGASLLEDCSIESSQHGEMSHMQNYATAAKFFKSCAHEYESRQEMASATLAYHCTYVAYMRLVSCKNSSADRDRRELESAFQMVSQGESPSSSASDVDNINNQAAVDKATLPRAINAHVACNQVIPARASQSFTRLVDYARHIEFAMEASRKCQSTFTAARVIMEEAKSRNGDSIASVKSVINFSYHNIDELVRLVQTAIKAISRAGPDGARD